MHAEGMHDTLNNLVYEAYKWLKRLVLQTSEAWMHR